MGNKILPTLSLALKILNNTQINTKSTILTKIQKLSINGYNRGQHAQVFEKKFTRKIWSILLLRIVHNIFVLLW